MQAACPQCQYHINIDDVRAPERAFSVKCPKCQTSVRFPGRGAAHAASAEVAATSAATTPMASETPASPAFSEDLRASAAAQIRRDMGVSADPATPMRAMVAVGDRAQAGALTLSLTRLGFSVDALEDGENGFRLVEQGHYPLVVTTRSAGTDGRGESLYARLNRLGSEARRRLFLLLVDNDFKSGDGVQAFVALADLVLHPRDVAGAELLLRNAVAERARLYHGFLDAQRRFEALTH